MKKLIISLILIGLAFASFAQQGSQALSGVFLRVNDTTTYQAAAATRHSQGYHDIYFNNQATTPHFDIWNGSSYDHVFDFNAGVGVVQSVTGDGVDNTDPDNPVLTFPIASEVVNTPSGGIAATNVQAALNELDTEKANLASLALKEDAANKTTGFGTVNNTLFPTVQAVVNYSLPLSGSASLTGPLTITGSSSNTLKFLFPSLGITATNGAGIWLANTTSAAPANQQISPGLVFEGQGWKTNATAASQSVKFSEDVLPVQGTTAPSGQLRFRSSIDNGAYSNSIMSLWSDGRVSIGTSSPQSSTTLSVDRFDGSNNNIVSFLSSGSSLWRITATGNVVHTASNALTVGGSQIYSLGGTYSAASGNPETIILGLAPTINYTGTVSGAVVVGYNFDPVTTSTTGTQLYSFRGIKGSAVFGKSSIDASSTRVQITGTGTGSAYNILTQDLSNNNEFGVRDDGKIFFFTSPVNDDSETKFLVWDSSGEIQYKNESSLGVTSFWNITGSTTSINASLTGTAVFDGEWGHTATMTDDADARPVNDNYTFLTNPASAPGITIDYHGIDYSMTTAGSNINANVNLYPLEVTAGHNTTATMGNMVNLYINSRNILAGTVTNMTGIRLLGRNNSTGTVSNYYGVRLNNPNNSGTWTNWYGVYVDDITTPTNYYGIYSLANQNFIEKLTVSATPANANSTLHVNGSLATAYAAKTTTYTITDNDYFIDCTSGSFTVTLPTAVGITGRIYIIKNSGAGTISLATTSSQTIDGASPGSLATTVSIRLVSNGANWISF